MLKTDKDMNLMLLKMCEELLPKTKLAGDAKITNAMKTVRQYLEGKADEPLVRGDAK